MQLQQIVPFYKVMAIHANQLLACSFTACLIHNYNSAYIMLRLEHNLNCFLCWLCFLLTFCMYFHSTGPHGFLGFLNIVMTGLMSQMPRAISATVQGLSRLVHKFNGLVDPVADKLLRTVLTLVRAKCREVDASVLGFLNVSCCG